MSQADTQSALSQGDLVGSRWVFGARGQAPVTTTFRFGESGSILDYEHANEDSWRLNGSVLEIYRNNGLLMWTSDRVFQRDDGRTCITLKTPFDAQCEFALCQYQPPLDASDYLFPKDLRVTPTRFKRILMIGSCLTTQYLQAFARCYPDVRFDQILFNMAGDLPEAPPAPLAEYDFQYLQLPLRSILSDRIIQAQRFNDDGFATQILRDGCGVIDVMLASALRYHETHGLLSFVSNFFVPQMNPVPALRGRGRAADLSYIVARLNEHLAERVASYRAAYLLDVNALANSIGKRHMLDDLMFFYSHGSVQILLEIDPTADSRIEPVQPITEFYELKPDEFIRSVLEQMVASYRTVRQIDQVKAVVFDLDHTLWRGQLAEHYRPENSDRWPAADGWPMGLWEAVHHLRARGILVALCSKNDRATVEKNWGNAVRPEFMSLEDFSSVKINWQPKADNIRAICEELSLKPKSVVFVDDNPVERAAVKAALPGIRVIGSNPLLTRRILLWAPETQVAALSEESIRREELIRKQMVREETRATLSREQFLATLGSMLRFTRIDAADHPDFGRALELINKTNQFNTTGRRWTPAEVIQFLAGRGQLWALRVSDRYADYGLVGVLLIREARMEQFVMSCRVLGMEVELAAVAHIVSLLRRERQSDITAALTETADNTPCRQVYANSGFTRMPASSTQQQLYLLPQHATVRMPAHIRVVE
jgi:FkbH-like protein